MFTEQLNHLHGREDRKVSHNTTSVYQQQSTFCVVGNTETLDFDDFLSARVSVEMLHHAAIVKRILRKENAPKRKCHHLDSAWVLNNLRQARTHSWSPTTHTLSALVKRSKTYRASQAYLICKIRFFFNPYHCVWNHSLGVHRCEAGLACWLISMCTFSRFQGLANIPNNVKISNIYNW